MPDAATAFAAQDAAEKTKAMQDTTALQQKPARGRGVEGDAVARSEANDHSTTALDKNKGG